MLNNYLAPCQKLKTFINFCYFVNTKGLEIQILEMSNSGLLKCGYEDLTRMRLNSAVVYRALRWALWEVQSVPPRVCRS